ncbi:MAG: amidohydrolase family protein [Chloroflexi bacterium]|nr:amidohydrolase family protein [Chloroflexota bacterium]MBI3734530.1 amidohydrolase family protein [Chloroflexota bacterium]
MERTLIRASHIIAYDGKQHRYLKDGVAVYEGDTIIHVGKTFDGAVDHLVNAAGRVVTPGFIDTHIHMAGSPLDKSFIEDHGKRNFYNSGLFEMLPARSAAQDNDANHLCVEFSMAELLHTGTTCALEMGPVHAYTAEQAARFGFRAYIGPMYRSGRWYTDDGKSVKYHWDEAAGNAAFERAVTWIEQNDGAHGGLVKGFLSPAQVDTCSEALLQRTREAANRMGVPIQIHAAQSVAEFQEMVRRHGQSPIEWLRDVGLLGPDVILGHAIILAGGSWAQYAGDDIAVMAQAGCSVAHAPWVFARRGIALESFGRYLKAGVNMTLGTDTAPQSMIEAMKFAAVIGKIMDRQTEVATAADVFNAATLGGAKAIGRDDLGRIAPGAKADLVIWEGESIWMSPLRDPIKNIVFNAQAEDVKTVIVNGKTVMQDGVIPSVPDIKTLARQLQAAGARMWANIPRGDWAEREADELSPQSFALWDGA